MRKGGLEPPRSCDRQPLKLVRLPIPPLPHLEAWKSNRFAHDGERSCPPTSSPEPAMQGQAKTEPAPGERASLEWFSPEPSGPEPPYPEFPAPIAPCVWSPTLKV